MPVDKVTIPYSKIGQSLRLTAGESYDVPENLNNPIWYMTQFLIRNGVPPGSDKGLYSHQHNVIRNVILPGSKYTTLELGDMVAFDNDSFAAADISIFGDTFTNKLFLITRILTKENGVIIREAIEVRQQHITPAPPNPFD